MVRCDSKYKHSEIRSMKEAGWKYVSKHRKSPIAHKQARKTLKKMFQAGKRLPQVKVTKICNTHYVWKMPKW